MKKCLLIALLCVPLPLNAQKAGFVSLLGNDTIAAETFTLTPTSLEGQLTAVSTKKMVAYSADMLNGRVTRLRIQGADLTFAGDTTPFINLAFSFVDVLTRRMVRAGSDSMALPIVLLGSPNKHTGYLVRSAPDAATLTIAGVTLALKLGTSGEILRATVAAQNLTVLRTSGENIGVANRDYRAPAGAAYTAEDVAITTGAGHVLAGTLTLPKRRSGAVPVVVTISGSGQQERDENIPGLSGYAPFRQYAEALAARGIGVLRYDDRGVGNSGGNPTSATSADFADDTRAVLEWLRTRSDVDAQNLFLLGHSEGGMIAPMVAATDTAVRGIVLLAGPGYTGRRIIEFQRLDRDTTLLALPWMRFFRDHDPLPVARRVRAPVLILHGATDRQVTPEQAPILAAAFRESGNADVTMHVLPEVNHLFLKDPNGDPAGYGSLPDKKVPGNVVAMISDWIIQHVK